MQLENICPHLFPAQSSPHTKMHLFLGTMTTSSLPDTTSPHHISRALSWKTGIKKPNMSALSMLYNLIHYVGTKLLQYLDSSLSTVWILWLAYFQYANGKRRE